jgi:hypothetical protein
MPDKILINVSVSFHQTCGKKLYECPLRDKQKAPPHQKARAGGGRGACLRGLCKFLIVILILILILPSEPDPFSFGGMRANFDLERLDVYQESITFAAWADALLEVVPKSKGKQPPAS